MRQRHFIAVTMLAILLLGGGAVLLWRTGFFQSVTTLAGTQQYIERFSPYSELVFFLLQLASVILAPIPSNITAAAGGLLFGTWPAFLLTWSAVVLGSMTVFFLSRSIGQPFAARFVNQKISERYLDVIARKRDVFLILVFLFPFFPDDIICILAGLTDIGYLRFFLIILLSRPWGLLVASAVGGNAIAIPLWGMVLIGLLGIVLFAVGMKYGDRLEERLIARFKN